MDPRLGQLQRMRDLKMEAANRDFLRAYQAFVVAYNFCEAAMARQQTFEREAEAATKADMARVTGGAMGIADIQAIHDASARRAAANVLLQQEVERLTQERERCRAGAIEKQKILIKARKDAEKLGILREKLRGQEISLQNRLSESFADSVTRDLVTDQWKLRLMDY